VTCARRDAAREHSSAAIRQPTAELDQRNAATRVIKPLRDIAGVKSEHVGPLPYPALNSAFDASSPPGLHHYRKADYLTGLTDEAVAAHVEHGRRILSANSTMHAGQITRQAAGRRQRGDRASARGLYVGAQSYRGTQPNQRRRADASLSAGGTYPASPGLILTPGGTMASISSSVSSSSRTSSAPSIDSSWTSVRGSTTAELTAR